MLRNLMILFEDESEEDVEEVEKSYPVYTKKNFLSEVFMSEGEYERLIDVLRVKKKYYSSRSSWCR